VQGGPFYTQLDTKSSSPQERLWWKAFEDPLLNGLMASVLTDNFTLKQGYARIKQAMAFEKQARAALFPPVNISTAATSTWDSDGAKEDNLIVDMGLSWEIDFWKQLSSAGKAAVLERQASRDELETSALLISGQVAETYFRLVELKLHLALFERQIQVNETFLHLIKLRFVNGSASAVDIYQQAQQLAAIRSKTPVVKGQITTLENRLHVFLGLAPSGKSVQVATKLPDPPALPAIGIPSDLMMKRPDLRRRHKTLIAADYRVAQAVADRLPKITIGLNTGFNGETITDNSFFFSLFGQAIAPIVDWEKRKNEVRKQKAVVEEELALFTQIYITAIGEVENALWQEKQHRSHLLALNEQLAITRATLTETRKRYMQGITDYLPVLNALQSLQSLEHDILLKSRELILFRILLYRALGGSNLLDNFSPATETYERSQ
jgi:NodT family efflux transporter outer membrane factor (OMF) lipoprotein